MGKLTAAKPWSASATALLPSELTMSSCHPYSEFLGIPKIQAEDIDKALFNEHWDHWAL